MTPPTVWIYSNPYPDGPVRLIRAAATAQIAQREGPDEQVWVNGETVVWGTPGVQIPPGFSLALAQALDTARRAAGEQDHDQVVTARIEGGQLVWKVYPVHEVPESPNPKPEAPAAVPDQQAPSPWGMAPAVHPGGYPPPHPADL
ncbi:MULTISPECIES: hypothetical protein [unclassified Streptomyces]|uniref:hypothetical protein n=1 Tax=unclassified Streptomyces TaxID=2593676 RepID=UPI0037FC000D